MLRLTRERLEKLRDKLRKRGQRQSMILPSADANLIEAMEIIEEFGAIGEALYLMMAADGRVLNVEREVMRGCLDVVSGGRARTVHMEAMIDAAARRSAKQGAEARLAHVISVLQDDPLRAEITLLLAAAVAAADHNVTPEEHALLETLAEGFGVSEERANQILDELTQDKDGEVAEAKA